MAKKIVVVFEYTDEEAARCHLDKTKPGKVLDKAVEKLQSDNRQQQRVALYSLATMYHQYAFGKISHVEVEDF